MDFCRDDACLLLGVPVLIELLKYGQSSRIAEGRIRKHISYLGELDMGVVL